MYTDRRSGLVKFVPMFSLWSTRLFREYIEQVQRVVAGKTKEVREASLAKSPVKKVQLILYKSINLRIYLLNISHIFTLLLTSKA